MSASPAIERPLTPNMVEVLGALRFADEHELDLTQLQVRTRLHWQAVARAVSDLRRRGLVRKRRDPDALDRRYYLFSLASGAAR